MVVLKKIKGSTLMETLVATVLIVVIFMISSMILNNLFSNTIKKNTRAIEAHINELQYLCKNEKLIIPYYDDFNSWDIAITTQKDGNKTIILFEAINTETNQSYSKQSVEMSTN
ncbi:hypothetical protein [Flavivirga jejuensis]|uniref:Prepilin-type N-terminal cleavage/methylation domain-containing protein n=1 Tax=Flavivirga jejuensis TaxID=870487 RepID=A0ABT8WMY6_9FLAO|nr:hypothetical protein [Flavivirga jejuensis]MDO5974524.1 hypothetical protein [Flavivirga jejuensis]